MRVLTITTIVLLSMLTLPLAAQVRTAKKVVKVEAVPDKKVTQDTTKKDAKTQAVLEALVGQLEKEKKGKIQLEDISGGIIFDQTKTRAGRDFSDLFIQNLEIPENITDYQIVIDETPGLGTSTIVKVTINEMEVYSNYLQPRQDRIEETSMEALEYATSFIINYNQILLELESKEQRGTGIF